MSRSRRSADAQHALTHALATVTTGQSGNVDSLREDQSRLDDLARQDTTSLHSRRLGVVAAHLDPLVDSINTAAHVLSRPAQTDRLS